MGSQYSTMDRDTDIQERLNNKNYNNTYRRCHSRQRDQHGIILEFLSSLDKNKPPWQNSVNKINKDWATRMEEEGREEESKARGEQDKHVTWRENLLDVRVISPKQTKLSKTNILTCCTNTQLSPQIKYSQKSLPRIKKLDQQLGILNLISSN